MPTLNMTAPDLFEFQPALVLLLWDGFTGSNQLAGDVVVKIGGASPLFQNSPAAQFVFVSLPNGSYTVNVESAADEPYYTPVSIPIRLPFQRPNATSWNPQPVWPAYPDIVLADPTKMLDDPAQTAAYVAQRALASLAPAASYPFPEGATLVRGAITAAGVPLPGALVTTVPVAIPGQYPVTVVGPTGAASAAQTLSVVHAPVIESIQPPTVVAGAQNFTLIAGGAGFAPGAVLKWNNTALATTFLSSGGVMAQIPAAQVAAPSQAAIVVVSPDGTTSNSQTLTVTAAAAPPSIASIAPPSIMAGSAGFQLSVLGAGFAPAAVVMLNGVPLATAFLNATGLNATVTATQVATAAQLNVTVVNPSPPAQSSNTQTLGVVATPVINSLDPAAVVAGSLAFNLVVSGSGFVSGAVVKAGANALTTEFISATELSAAVTADLVVASGQLSIAAANPNGAVSPAKSLPLVAAPVIGSIAPTTVSAGGAPFTLVVNGSAFASGAEVELDGTPLATTFLNSTQLTAIVPRSGYTTGSDGAYVLFFDEISGSGETVTLLVSHPSYPNPKSILVTVVRGATVTANIDMST